MSRPFDFEGVFDDDYLYFYETLLTPERSDQETTAILDRLALPAGAEILDAPCGHGRIANRLAARGHRVTGLDASERYLEVARAEAEKLGVSVDYVRGDLRSLPWTGRFDAIVNWFTSFGYFGDDEDRAVLRGMYAALKPGGSLLLETLARDRVVRSLPAPDWPPRVLMLQERGDDFLLDRITFDEDTGSTSTERIVIRDGRVRRTHFSVRMFTPTEIASWMRHAGFSDVSVTDGDGAPFTLESRRMLVLARA